MSDQIQPDTEGRLVPIDQPFFRTPSSREVKMEQDLEVIGNASAIVLKLAGLLRLKMIELAGGGIPSVADLATLLENELNLFNLIRSVQVQAYQDVTGDPRLDGSLLGKLEAWRVTTLEGRHFEW